MKKYTIILIASALAVLTVSCKKESAGVTRITYYPTITLQGDDPAIIKVGDAFTDPGFTAVMNGEDISSDVTVTSLIDNTTPGVYSVKYSTTNSDGIVASASRSVYVINPGNISNLYYGHSRNASGTRNYPGCPTLVLATSTPDVYFVDDLLAGYYYYGIYPGYEPTYDFHWEGYIKINTDNSISLVSSGDWLWYDPADTVVGSYDPANGTFSWVCYGSVGVTLTPITID